MNHNHEGCTNQLTGILRNLFEQVPYALNKTSIKTDEILALHAATVVIDGRGYVFVGNSGAGKTTISSIGHKSGLTILSDELVFIVNNKETNEYWVYGTPVSTSEEYIPFLNIGVPIAKVFVLNHGLQCNIKKVSLPVAVNILMNNVKNTVKQNFTAEEVIKLISKVLVLELSFPIDYVDWNLISN